VELQIIIEIVREIFLSLPFFIEYSFRIGEAQNKTV